MPLTDWPRDLLAGKLDAKVTWNADFTKVMRGLVSGKTAIAGKEFMEARYVDEATVSATATAEAYNPAYSQNNIGNFVPAAPKCVKPFLVPNLDPGSSSNPPQKFVDETKGLVTPGASFLGEEIQLTSPCQGNANNKKGNTRGTSPSLAR